jgi:hypothetical protein
MATTTNYDNPKVKEIKGQMGSYDYSPAPRDDGVFREERPEVSLENGARYSGEWNKATNKRDGKG